MLCGVVWCGVVWCGKERKSNVELTNLNLFPQSQRKRKKSVVKLPKLKDKLSSVSKSVISGIPIMPRFARAADKMIEGGGFKVEALKEFGMNPNDTRPVVVVMSGGKLIKRVFENSLACKVGLRFVVVMGRQADVRGILEKVQVPERHDVTLVGFCKEMPKLLAAADLMVGKCGGLTAAENAALGVPIVILDPIPGQEQRNSDILLESGGCVKVNDLPLLTKRLEDIFRNNGEKLKSMQRGIKKLAKPNAAYTIVDDIIGA